MQDMRLLHLGYFERPSVLEKIVNNIQKYIWGEVGGRGEGEDGRNCPISKVII